jgi:DNA-directed RNA polymerase beta' subunit
MGKLKEKLLNNLSQQEMDEQFELSAFEYVELMSKYKTKNEEEYIPTDEELANIDAMVEEYYKSKEFRDYVENYTPTDEYVDSLTDEQIDEAFAEHNADEDELDRINDSLRLKFTEDDVIEAVKALKNEDWFIKGIRRELNNIWNRKNGVF